MDNQNKLTPQEEAAFAQLQKDYDSVIERTSQELTATHSAKEYTFTVIEKRRLIEQETIRLLVMKATDDIINYSVLPRIGIALQLGNRVLYDATLGRLTIFTPKQNQASDGDSPGPNSTTSDVVGKS